MRTLPRDPAAPVFVRKYPRITHFIPCDTFGTASTTKLQSQPGLLKVQTPHAK